MTLILRRLQSAGRPHIPRERERKWRGEETQGSIHTLSLSLSLSHTHKHMSSSSLGLVDLFLSLSLSLSLSLTHTHTHMSSVPESIAAQAVYQLRYKSTEYCHGGDIK